MSTKTTLIVVALMAALSIAAIATVVNPAAALPSRVPENRGTATGGCASAAQGPGAQTCAVRGPT